MTPDRSPPSHLIHFDDRILARELISCSIIHSLLKYMFILSSGVSNHYVHASRIYQVAHILSLLPKTPKGPKESTKKYMVKKGLSAKRHGAFPCGSPPSSSLTALASHATQGHRLEGVRFPTPQHVVALLLLERRNPEVRHSSTEDHTSTKNQKSNAVALS